MPKSIKKILPYVLLFVLISILTAYFILRNQTRTITSTNEMAPVEMAKHKMPVTVKIVRTEESLTQKLSGETELIGYITVNTPYSDELFYKWELPDGIRLLEGTIEDSFIGVPPGQTLTTRILVQGFSEEENKVIVLHGHYKINDFVIGSTAIFANHP